MMDPSARITWEIREGIGILTLNNPPRNCLYEPGFIPPETLRSWLSDDALKGVLIHGKGRHFSSGGDLARLYQLVSSGADMEQKLQEGHDVLRIFSELNLPLIEAIEGVCFGGGLELALICDISVAGESALFAFPEIMHGLVPGMGGTVRLPAKVGKAKSMEMILSGDLVNAGEAKKINLVDHVVPRGESFRAAYSLLSRMTRGNHREIIRVVMKILRNSTRIPAEEAIREEVRLFCEMAVREARRRASESI